ncbi:RING/FYVE/PHD zinc finger superfamily protein [Striga asiatica]|uniref:RING/FYVE/PHD zinc finger superfamily protein n=1 Tax=Striga asiatica TaxID=4170 RepID=A0A5A7QRS9_STRAF|nr:RING/FYVE/PHD zinc finger superfamily protein [Striga asiatica]
MMDATKKSSPRKLEECRICHDEDDESNMEVPCFCRGSLKYAHRKCVQRWCDEKGDTVCEICLQLFKPDYTAPPPLFHYSGIPMNFRGNWEISRSDLRNPQFIFVGSNDRSSLYPNFDDLTENTSRNLICCRIVAMIFIILLIMRHTLPLFIYGAGEYSISLVMLLMLRTIGILLPIYIIVKALTAIQRRQNRQDFPVLPHEAFIRENEVAGRVPEAHVIQTIENGFNLSALKKEIGKKRTKNYVFECESSSECIAKRLRGSGKDKAIMVEEANKKWPHQFK